MIIIAWKLSQKIINRVFEEIDIFWSPATDIRKVRKKAEKGLKKLRKNYLEGCRLRNECLARGVSPTHYSPNFETSMAREKTAIKELSDLIREIDEVMEMRRLIL